MAKYDLSIYRGAIVALNACYGENGDADPAITKRLVRWYMDKGVTGFYVNGSSGEGIMMTVPERKATIEAVMAETAGSGCVVINHVGAYTTRDAVELAAHSEKVRCDAISSIPCLPFRVPEYAIKAYWDTITDASDLPFIIYNMPGLTGYNLTFSLFREMLKNPKVIGIKNTSESVYQTEQFRAIAGKDFVIFNGPDEQYLAGRMMGATAGIGGTYGTMPELFLALERCIVGGDFERAKTIQSYINDIIANYLLVEPPILSVVKHIIAHRTGFSIGVARPPLQTKKYDDKIVVEAVEKITGYVNAVAKMGV